MPASTPTAGSAGIFKISTVALIQCQTVDLTSNGATYDVTVMSGMSTPVWKAFIAGLRDWTVKVTGLYDQANDALQATLWAAYENGTIEAVSFSPNAGTNTFTGNALITSIPFKFDVKAASTAEWDFQGTGPLSFA
jgi:predicted secreted protein